MDSHIVASDIADPTWLRKVVTIREDFGARKQCSVFFCRLSATDMVTWRSRLYDVINLNKHEVLIRPMSAKCVGPMERIGQPPVPPEVGIVT